jgi:hypothetical protein
MYILGKVSVKRWRKKLSFPLMEAEVGDAVLLYVFVRVSTLLFASSLPPLGRHHGFTFCTTNEGRG